MTKNSENNGKDPKAEREHPDQAMAESEEQRTRRQAEDKGVELLDADNGDYDPEGGAQGFPIIGIGASAGGLEAMEMFLSQVPKDSGMAFVIISHTDPGRVTMLPEILQKTSKIPVTVIKNGTRPEPNGAYLPPSDKDVTIEDGIFHLKARETRDGLHMPIDRFLRSLADDYAAQSGCVILSGTGSDGTQGLRHIKEKAGVAVSQEPESARYGGMPQSAIGTGLADFVLSPEEMPERLMQFFNHRVIMQGKGKADEQPSRDLQSILAFLANRTQHDFSQYKSSTLIRRVERRMSVTGTNNAAEYVSYLHRNPQEAESLFDDLLIGVTNFFREPEAFSFLGEEVLPDLIQQSEQEGPLRIWVAGCATGEEAYSIAIIVQEALEKAHSSRGMQIFATDLDKKAIEKARHGSYIETIAADVSAERLKKFFIMEDRSYRLKGDIRENVVFAVQNVLRDPPFSGLDLLVCRNLLIYLKSQAQQRLLPLFHYTLKKDGILFLGSSESVGRFGRLFTPIEKKYNIYRKQDIGAAARPAVDFPTGIARLEAARQEKKPDHGEDLAQATGKMLLKEYTPTCVIVNREGRINYTHGRAGKYIEVPQGRPNLDIKQMAREGIRFALTSALRNAAESGEEIRQEKLRVKIDGGYQDLNLVVKPFAGDSALKGTFAVIFEDIGCVLEKDAPKAGEPTGDRDGHITELENELNRLSQQYQGSLEELQSSNEELRSANEETRSSNEELQSTNEEFESSREELQSLNEELSTVNKEIDRKSEEVSRAYEHITYVLDVTRIAILFLDKEMLVRRFTKEAARLFNLIETDVGRPISHISHNLDYERFNERMRRVLADLTPFEDEVRTKDGHWYRMRLSIFRTRGHIIEGTVATFINIDAQKHAMAGLQASERRFRALVEASSQVLYRMSADWGEMLELYSRGFLAETKEPSRQWLDKYIPSDVQSQVTAVIGESIRDKKVFEMEHRVIREDGTVGWTLSRAVPIRDANGEIIEWFGAASDITAQKRTGKRPND